MKMLPLAFQSGDTLLAELDPDHYITDKKRVVAKLTADNLWVKPVVAIVPSEFVSIANAEHKRLTEPYRWMQEYQKTQVFKHGDHDQTRHDNRRSAVSPTVVSDTQRLTADWGGLSINMVDGSMPTAGFMVAKPPEFSKVVEAKDFFDPKKGPKILADYMKTNKKDLASGKNYLGTWLNEGKVYLDVSENIMDRAEAIRLGQERNQLAIYDVVAGESIDTGGTGSVGKRSQYSSNQRYIRNDRQRGRRLRPRALGKNDSGEVDKHLAGKHDQATHGRKKFNYFTAGSLFKDQDSLQSSIEGLTDPNKSQFANGNVAIKVLLERQGKGGQPDVYDSIEELREVNPDAEIIYRGTDESYKDSMFNDDYDRTGTGAFGEGYYFTSSQPEATSYAEGGRTATHANPTVIQGAMKPNARVKVFSNTEELDDYGRDAMNKAVRDIEATGLDSRTLSPDGRRTTRASDFTTASFYNTHTTAASTQLILEGFDAMQFVSDYQGFNTYTVVFNREAMQVVAD